MKKSRSLRLSETSTERERADDLRRQLHALEAKQAELHDKLTDKEVELVEMKEDTDGLFEQLAASWKVATALEEDLRKWQERERHDEQDREMLQRRLTRVIEEKQEQERRLDRQNENVIAENMLL